MVELPVSKTICPLVLQPGFRLNALCSPPDGRAVGSARPNRGAIRAKTCSDPPPRPAHPIASPCRIYLPADITHKPGCSTSPAFTPWVWRLFWSFLRCLAGMSLTVTDVRAPSSRTLPALTFSYRYAAPRPAKSAASVTLGALRVAGPLLMRLTCSLPLPLLGSP